MGRYITENLIGDEQVIYEASISLWALWPSIVIAAFLTFFAGIGLLLFLWLYFLYKGSELGVTNERLIIKQGVISRKTTEINIDRLESIQLRQGVFGRLLNYGHVVASGAGIPEVKSLAISNPNVFKNQVLQTKKRYTTR